MHGLPCSLRRLPGGGAVTRPPPLRNFTGPAVKQPCRRQLGSGSSRRQRYEALRVGGEGSSSLSPEPQVYEAVLPPPGGPPPPAALVRPAMGVSWFTVIVVVGVAISTVAGSFLMFMLYLRPVLKAAEKATDAAEKAAREIEVAAQEMERTAKMMQEDMPLTFQDMQRTSKEFEILGKQLNLLAAVLVKPVKEPVQWVGRAAETTSSTMQSVTSTSIRRVMDDIKTLTNSLTPTLTQVRKQLGLALSSSSTAAQVQQLCASAASSVAIAAPRGGKGIASSVPLSRAGEVAIQAEAAAREVAVSRRQADAQQWIAAWRSRSRGNKKAAAAAASKDEDGRLAAAAGLDAVEQDRRLAQMSQMLAGGMLHVEHEATTAAVFAALERAQRAAQEAASASGALEAAIKQAENNGALPSIDEDDYD